MKKKKFFRNATRTPAEYPNTTRKIFGKSVEEVALLVGIRSSLNLGCGFYWFVVIRIMGIANLGFVSCIAPLSYHIDFSDRGYFQRQQRLASRALITLSKARKAPGRKENHALSESTIAKGLLEHPALAERLGPQLNNKIISFNINNIRR